MILSRLVSQRNITISSINNPSMPLFQALTGGGTQIAGVTVNPETAMRVMAVHACVRLIAEAIAALPLGTYTGIGDARRPVRVGTESYVWGEPNPEMTRQEFWEQVLEAQLIDGNGFIYTPRNGAGEIAELWPLPPRAINPERAKDGGLHYEIQGERTQDSTAIVHIPAYRQAGALRGVSPIGRARLAIGLSMAAESFGANLFSQGATMSGIIKTKADMNVDEATRFLAIWNLQHQGVSNAHKTGLLTNDADWVQTSIPPDDAQFLETRRYQVAEIARLYRVPLHMINETERSTSWGSGLEQLNIGFVIYTLLTWIRRNEQAVSKWLLPTRTRYALFNLNGLLRGDSQARAAFYREGRTGGWLSINDIRRLEDMPPIENGDDYLQPLNMAPVGSPAAKGLGDGDDDANVNGNGNRDDFRALIGATA